MRARLTASTTAKACARESKATLGSARSGMSSLSAGKGSNRCGWRESLSEEPEPGVTSRTKAAWSAGMGAIAAMGSCGCGLERRRMSERRLPSPWASPSSCSASITGSGRHMAGEPAAAALSCLLISRIWLRLARISAVEIGHGLVTSTPYDCISRTRSSARRVCASPSAFCASTMSSALLRSAALTAAGPAESERSSRQRACHSFIASAVLAYSSCSLVACSAARCATTESAWRTGSVGQSSAHCWSSSCASARAASVAPSGAGSRPSACSTPASLMAAMLSLVS
mmetsp:Transcript_29481/g.74813  ORF Transcript_29481/g.74813 Transcript_29481/m.74813 type:complete len:286 (-) Transcript_29481:315-1172(-)